MAAHTRKTVAAISKAQLRVIKQPICRSIYASTLGNAQTNIAELNKLYK